MAKKTSKPKSPSKKPTKRVKTAAPKVLEPEIVDLEAEIEELTDIEPKAESGLVPTDPVARYMAEVRRYPLLTREQEHELAVRYRETGDPEAAHKLVTSNLRFVVKIAAEYTKFGSKMIDLIQEGNVGLMHAVKEFNPYKGVRLITYAVWWIRGYIQEFLMRHYSMVRIGTTHKQRKLFYELQRSRDQLERMGMEAGILQISGRLGIPEDEVRQMSERVINRDMSLDRPVGTDEKTTFLELTPAATEEGVDEELGHLEQLRMLTQNLDRLRPSLTERELYVLDKRLLADEPLTLQEIGDKYKITREAARQMEARLIQKIRETMVSDETAD